MGKWTKFRDKLRRLPADGDYQTKVNAVKELPEMKNKDHAQLAERLKSLRQSKKDLEASLYAVNLNIEATSQLLLEWMEAAGLTKIELASGGLIFIQDEPYCRVSDMDELRRWIKANRLGNLLTIHWQTLNSMTKDALIAGEKIPGGVDLFMRSSLKVRGGKEADGDEEQQDG